MSSSDNTTVPSCAAHVRAGQYSATAQANFDPISWNTYYKNVVISAQVLPGLIIGVLCWIAALVFIVWLLLLCCRRVEWKTSRYRTYDDSDPRRNRWAAYNLVMTLITLGVIASCTWALIEGIHTTDHQIDDVWDLVVDIETELTTLSADVTATDTSLISVGSSVNATYNLINANQAGASSAGINVPPTLSILQTLTSQIVSGQDGTSTAASSLTTDGLDKVAKLQNEYQHTTTNAWSTYRPIVIAVFFGLLIVFGVFTGFLAVLDRTPRTTVVFTLLLLIWTGCVLFLGTGLLNVLWRTTRDFCLYGITYAASKLGGQVTLNYYFQKTYIAPQDVSQQLFGFNLTSTIETLTDPTLLSLINTTQTSSGQTFINSNASPQDAASINALSTNLGLLSGNLTALNDGIQASAFAGITNGVMSLICCSLTNALWELWLASTITGALAGLLSVLAIIKIVTAIQPQSSEAHFTPHSPNKIPHGTVIPIHAQNA